MINERYWFNKTYYLYHIYLLKIKKLSIKKWKNNLTVLQITILLQVHKSIFTCTFCNDIYIKNAKNKYINMPDMHIYIIKNTDIKTFKKMYILTKYYIVSTKRLRREIYYNNKNSRVVTFLK